jgi:hypothetical protein
MRVFGKKLPKLGDEDLSDMREDSLRTDTTVVCYEDVPCATCHALVISGSLISVGDCACLSSELHPACCCVQRAAYILQVYIDFNLYILLIAGTIRYFYTI